MTINKSKFMRGFFLVLFTLFFVSLGCVATDSKMVAHAKTITVNKVDGETAKKVHSVIYKGKSLTLKVKGNSSESGKKIRSLVKKVGEVNQYAVIFHYKKGSRSGRYYNYSISRENAQLYMYTVKLMKKKQKRLLKSIDKDNLYEKELQDITTYPDEKERKMHIIYDSMIRDFLDSFSTNVPVEGYDEPTTVSVIEEYSICYWEVNLYDEITDEDGWLTGVHVNSYQEFIEKNDMDALLKQARFQVLSPQEKLLKTKPFYKLSDAMKVYAVDATGIFDAFSGDVHYDYEKRTPTSGSKGMKYLYKGNAYGVCMHFADYECLLWEQLGIKCYWRSSYKINHAWSVVKVKNSKGKTLWIPYDYGIGPAENLQVTEEQRKYVNTEAKRYKLYLSGIKGAPKKRNWKWTDFN